MLYFNPAWFVATLLFLPVLSASELERAHCGAASLAVTSINVGSGVVNDRVNVVAPLSIEVPYARDPQRYNDCLRREGINPMAQAEAYFEKAHHCNGQVRNSGAVTISETGQNVVDSPVDAEDYRRCMDTEVEVEVIELN